MKHEFYNNTAAPRLNIGGRINIIDNGIEHSAVIWHECLNKYCIYIKADHALVIDYLIANNICIIENYRGVIMLINGACITGIDPSLVKLVLTSHALLELI
jgi:hypothetical protein